jgi:DnaK suppressor protein
MRIGNLQRDAKSSASLEGNPVPRSPLFGWKTTHAIPIALLHISMVDIEHAQLPVSRMAPASKPCDNRSRWDEPHWPVCKLGRLLEQTGFLVQPWRYRRENMKDQRVALDPTYVQDKRHQLLKLRAEIQRLSNAAEGEEELIRADTLRDAGEFEDDAEKLDLLERQGLLVNRSCERLTLIERALAKIANGTYGYSDESGERIPDERLELMPEAINTLREQEIAEREAR